MTVCGDRESLADLGASVSGVLTSLSFEVHSAPFYLFQFPDKLNLLLDFCFARAIRMCFALFHNRIKTA
jgi:hypothetical protein